MKNRVKIGFACAGTPTPAVARFGTAYVLSIDGHSILIDCGPAATYKLTRLGVNVTDISEILFTHHHYDHDSDYPCLVLTRWNHLVDHSTPLRVWGPEPTERLTQALFGEQGVYALDWRARTEAVASKEIFVSRGGSLPRPALRVEARDVTPGMSFRVQGCDVSVHTACHVQPWLSSVGYRIETPAGGVCFVGDSGPCQTITEAAQGARVLVVNCWDHTRHMDDDPVSCCMFNPREAGALAAHTGVARLVLAHLSAKQASLENRETLQAAVRDGGYAGECIVAEEGMWLPV